MENAEGMKPDLKLVGAEVEPGRDSLGEADRPAETEAPASGIPDASEDSDEKSLDQLTPEEKDQLIQQLMDRFDGQQRELVGASQRLMEYRRLIAAILASVAEEVIITPAHMAAANPGSVVIESTFEGFTTLRLKGRIYGSRRMP